MSHNERLLTLTCLPAVIAIVALTLFYSIPNKTMHAAAFNILAKTYSNSVLAIFNSRIQIVGGREITEEEPKAHISLHSKTKTSSSLGGTQTSKSEAMTVRERQEIHLSMSTDSREQVIFSSERYNPSNSPSLIPVC